MKKMMKMFPNFNNKNLERIGDHCWWIHPNQHFLPFWKILNKKALVLRGAQLWKSNKPFDHAYLGNKQENSRFRNSFSNFLKIRQQKNEFFVESDIWWFGMRQDLLQLQACQILLLTKKNYLSWGQPFEP